MNLKPKIMDTKLKQIQKLLEELKEIDPEKISAFQRFALTTEKEDGILSKKVKSLINVSLSVSAQCEWCIALHVKDALGNGASEKEIVDAAMQAVLMHGGPALMYMILVMDAFKEDA